ncbi:MAG TPA: FkbM family methyltransferase [Pseudonocardiaceae bacterium]
MADHAAARVAAGTVVSRGYLPAARVLAESFLRHHPDAVLRVLVLDATDDDVVAQRPWPAGALLVTPDRLSIPADDYHRMAAAYSVTELATAVKPSLLRLLLTEADVAIYLDPDIEVFAPFPELADLVLANDIVLTPHVTEPMPRDGLRPTEADIMASGVFNLGFVAVSSAAMPFLDFWAERLRHDALVAPTEQMFTDQRWVDNVPALFRHTVLADPGFNVAYWNVYQRELATVDGELRAGGQPLRFYHFSGFRPERPWLLSMHFADQPRVLLSEQPVLARLCADYRAKLIAAGYGDKLESVPYGWAALPDGTRLSASVRRMFRDAWVAAERAGTQAPPSPFGDGGVASFLAWAAAPADEEQRVAGSTRWAMALWRSRADLRQVFAEPLGADLDAYREWCATSGVAEGELHPAAVPVLPPAKSVPVRDEPGVNLLGYFSAELGVGEMGRLLLHAVRDAGLPAAMAVEEAMVANRTGHPLPAGLTGEPHYPVSVLCVNADMTKPAVRLHRELVADRHVIGLWSWELAEFPDWMATSFADVDEVWTISEFCRAAIAANAPVPVRVFPVPVRDPLRGTTLPVRPASSTTTFLFVFDYNSIFERKNPLAAVRAFQSAFGAADDVRLIIKSINGEQHQGDREKLRLAVAEEPRITLLEQYLDADEVGALFTRADCYLSLHRSEGFGLTVAEAMIRGLPVIATDYGGSAEVLTPDTGWPVGYDLVPVGPGCYPYPPDAVWAQPNLDAAVAALRAVVADPEDARKRGALAREHLLATRSPAAASAWVAARVADARRQWQQRGSTETPIGPADGPARTLDTAREALRWRADIGAPSRVPLAPAMRKVVLRAIDHYDHHQRNVLGVIVDGVETTVRQLDGRVTGVETHGANQHAALRDSVSRLADEVAAHRRAADGALAEQATRHAEQVAELTGRIDSVVRGLAEARDTQDTLDTKVMSLFAERDVRIDEVTRTATEAATAGAELAGRVHAVDVSVRNHNALLADTGDLPPTATVATDVGVLRLPADDTVMLPWLRHYASWEPAESRIIDHLLRPGDTFVDIGAHVGYFTVRALHQVGRAGAVFAVEPQATARTLLDHNVRANIPAADAAGLVVLPVAAWDADEDVTVFAGEPGNSGDHRVGAAGESGERVRGVRLAGVPELAQRQVRVVKCDAQGRDHRALAGLLDVLRRDRPDVLCEFWPAEISIGGADPATVVQTFQGWDYDVLPVTDGIADDLVAGRTIGRSRWSARGLVRLAEASSAGFVTLWLRGRH